MGAHTNCLPAPRLQCARHFAEFAAPSLTVLAVWCACSHPMYKKTRGGPLVLHKKWERRMDEGYFQVKHG